MSGKTQNTRPVQETAHKRPAAKPAAQAQSVDPVLLQRAITDLAHSAPTDVLALQHTMGNYTVQRLIQTKLTVGPAGDQYEQEADRVAEQVMTMPAPAQTQPTVQRVEEEEELQMKPLAASITPLVQRAPEEEEELQMKPLAERVQRVEEDEEKLQAKPLVQRAPEEEEDLQMKPLAEQVQRVEEDEEELQAKPEVQRASSGAGFEVGGEFEQQLAASRGGGSPLPAEVRSFMEPRFGADFSVVRLHTGGDAAQLNREVSAQAFTRGQDIYLGEGKDDLTSAQGKQLLAHELTHVVQQTGSQSLAASRIQRLTELALLGGSKETSRWGMVVSSVHAYNLANDQSVDERIRLLDVVEENLRASRALQTGSRGIRHRESRRDKRTAGQNLLQEINAERTTTFRPWTKYRALVGFDLPAGLTFEQATVRAARYQRGVDKGAIRWTLQLAHEIENDGTGPDMDAVFDIYVTRLQANKFKYTSSPWQTQGADIPVRGNCQNLANMLCGLGTALGFTVSIAVLPGTFFATRAEQDLISTHMGNVKYEGGEYDTRRFVFSMHVVAGSGGRYYDATVPLNKGFGNLDAEKAWVLEESGENRLKFTAVNDGATFPDNTPVAPGSAYLEKDGSRTSPEFGEYWIVKKIG